MSVLVEQQDETINVIETTAATVEKDTEVGQVFAFVVKRFLLTVVTVFNTQTRLWIRHAPRARSDGYASLSRSSSSSSLPLSSPSPLSKRSRSRDVFSASSFSDLLRACSISYYCFFLVVRTTFSTYDSHIGGPVILDMSMPNTSAPLYKVLKLFSRNRHLFCTQSSVNIIRRG